MEILRSVIKPSKNPLLHREALLNLLERTPGNILITGEPGVGKTALVEAFSARADRPVLLVATAGIAVSLESATLAELDTIRKELTKQSAYLFFDDAKSLLNPQLVNPLTYLLQPLLESSEIRVIIACSVADYRRVIEREPVLARAFTKLDVPELTIEECQDVMVSRAHALKNPAVSDTIAHDAAILAKRYLTERALPDKAIRLLEEARTLARHAHLSTTTNAHLKQVIAERTGIPLQQVSAAEQEKLLTLERTLNKEVIGQPHITKAVAQVIRRSRAGLQDAKRPNASFLFLGSSGVGKTELAKVLSKTVFHNEKALVRFDMSEFSEAHTVQRLIGAPPGYIGYEEGGQLTNTVLSQPYSLILLDELEKAHPKVFDMFLQVMDDGRLTDGKGRTVDFSNTIIIATSNLCLEEILADYKADADVTQKEWLQKRALPILTSYFRPEFLNRFDATLVFQPFSRESYLAVAELEVEKLVKRLESIGFSAELNLDEVVKAIAAEYDPTFGARPIRRYIQDNLENQLAEKILRGS